MNSKVKFHRLAIQEMEQSFRWYRKRSVRAAARFLTAIDDALERIVADPDSLPTTVGKCRRCTVDRFPFDIIFRSSNDVVFVVAVAHDKRRLHYWRRRV